MEKQLLISISREFGSGGHEIAQKVADDLGLPFYDRKMLDEIAGMTDVGVDVLEKYDEKPRNFILSRRVGKYTNSMEENIAQLQFEYIRQKAEQGESFVIVGRCSESVLREFKGLVSIFISGDRLPKIERVMKKYQLSHAEALAKMNRHDRKRKQYHNRYSDSKWGDSRYYDLCIKSSPLGVDGTVRVLEHYIQERTMHKET